MTWLTFLVCTEVSLYAGRACNRLQKQSGFNRVFVDFDGGSGVWGFWVRSWSCKDLDIPPFARRMHDSKGGLSKMISMSRRACIFVAGPIIAILCIIAYLQSTGSNVRLDTRFKLVSVPSSASSNFLKSIGSGKMDPLDEDLIQHLKHEWIFGPSTKPYHLANPDRKSWDQTGQSSFVDGILKQRRKGFYVECGAYDGETFSNSLFFEKYRDWEGLLIEPDPWNFEALLKLNRKALSVNACLATGRSPEIRDFVFADTLGGIPDLSQDIQVTKLIRGSSRVHCFPIRSLLAAIGRSHIDYYSLDVEGAEIEILKAFPWHDITVDVWTIEYAVYDRGPGTLEREKAVRDIFNQTGLYGEGQLVGPLDIVFVRKGVQ